MCVTRDGAGLFVQHESRASFHYKTSLMDGTEIDSSHKYGVPQTGIVGTGKIQSCIDQALMKMRPGTKATLVCPPEMAFGEEGTSIIPPNSTLVFEIELIGWEIPVEEN